MTKDSFIFHLENKEELEELTPEEAGLIFLAMISYTETGEEPGFTDRTLRTAWKPIRRRLQADSESYQQRCAKNQKNGAKGGRPKKEGAEDDSVAENRTVFLTMNEEPKKADSDSESDSDSDTEKETKEKADFAAHIPFEEIIDYLNQKTGSTYRADDRNTRKYILRRWKEGHSLNDFKTVIDRQAAAWLDDPKMVWCLRPMTIFSTKFDSYLHAPAASKTRNKFASDEQRPKSFWDDVERQLDQQLAAM